jgi:hypothetical protein
MVSTPFKSKGNAKWVSQTASRSAGKTILGAVPVAQPMRQSFFVLWPPGNQNRHLEISELTVNSQKIRSSWSPDAAISAGHTDPRVC